MCVYIYIHIIFVYLFIPTCISLLPTYLPPMARLLWPAGSRSAAGVPSARGWRSRMALAAYGVRYGPTYRVANLHNPGPWAIEIIEIGVFSIEHR